MRIVAQAKRFPAPRPSLKQVRVARVTPMRHSPTIDETERFAARWFAQMVSKESTMLSSIESRRVPFNPNARGYHAVYRAGEVNHCPGCGRTHWIIGRVSAECAFCSTALPLMEALTHGPAPAPVFWSGTRPSHADLAA
jgi:hypothetical protein